LGVGTEEFSQHEIVHLDAVRLGRYGGKASEQLMKLAHSNIGIGWDFLALVEEVPGGRGHFKPFHSAQTPRIQVCEYFSEPSYRTVVHMNSEVNFHATVKSRANIVKN
jgi:hypothetical protein